jgi:pyruvate kinase
MKNKKLKTAIVCTIGPASRPEKTLVRMMKAGMKVARLNFAHGTFREHGEDIRHIRRIAKKIGYKIQILIDLPGPKIRLGKLKTEPIQMKKGSKVTLTTQPVLGTEKLLPVNYEKLTASVQKDGLVYLNDGFIQLRVLSIKGIEVNCEVLVGGILYSFKGLNLPNARLYVEPVTDQDLKSLDFGLNHGVALYGLSFVEKAADILKVRNHAGSRGRSVRFIAKIERQEALKNIDSILKAADGLMVARGDLGVQIPIENVPEEQKMLIHKANRARKPVITATQMLESMVKNIRPTRAEATDVANAVFDGTGAVMLSEETAIGDYPAESVEMMARIARRAENSPYRHKHKYNPVRL